MTTTPRTISVIVPFLNRKEDVAGCLDSIESQNLPEGCSLEIIAVDNGSTDGTREALASREIQVLDCPLPGPAAARNLGIEKASGDVVVLIDSDCRARPNWLARLIVPLEEDGVAIAGGSITSPNQRTGVARFAEEFGILDQKAFFSGKIGMPPFLATANMALRRSWWERAGGFREDLRVGEDADFCWRVGDLGGGLAFVERAGVSHRHRENFKGLFDWGFAYGEGTAQLMRIHRKRFPRGGQFAWGYYPALAAAPIVIPWQMCFGEHLHDRRRGIYETVYRSGVLLGRWRGAIRHRVPCF